MRIAHLILAHKIPEQLGRLVEKLLHPDAVIFIHLDLKYEIKDFQIFEKHPSVIFIKKRVKVRWAGYQVVQATLNSIQEIQESGIAFDYLNLISGQDYPIKPINLFHEYLEQHQGKAFMEYFDIASEWTEAKPRIERYFLANYSFPGLGMIEKFINLLLPKRKTPAGFQLVGRSQWFTITQEQLTYIQEFVRNNPQIIQFFKRTWGADEIIFQSILYNSPFQKDMVNNNLRYIDWSEKKVHPKVLSIQDLDQIKKSHQFFARKFNSNFDSKILSKIDQLIS